MWGGGGELFDLVLDLGGVGVDGVWVLLIWWKVFGGRLVCWGGWIRWWLRCLFSFCWCCFCGGFFLVCVVGVWVGGRWFVVCFDGCFWFCDKLWLVIVWCYGLLFLYFLIVCGCSWFWCFGFMVGSVFLVVCCIGVGSCSGLFVWFYVRLVCLIGCGFVVRGCWCCVGFCVVGGWVGGYGWWWWVGLVGVWCFWVWKGSVVLVLNWSLFEFWVYLYLWCYKMFLGDSCWLFKVM